MATPIRTALLTEDDLMAMGSDARIEVIEGEVIEMAPVGGLHQFVGGNIHDILKTYVKEHQLGYVFYDGLLYLIQREDPGIKGALVPDVSFVRNDDIPPGWRIEKPFPGTPTLALEVVSPGDDPNDLLKKARLYLSAGTQEVWIIYPNPQEIHRYIKGQTQVETYAGDRILKTPLFPELDIPLQAVFDVPRFDQNADETTEE